MKLTKSFSLPFKIPPELKVFPPVPKWWHDHGSKMRVTSEPDSPNTPLVIEGSAAQVTILHFGEGHDWFVDWQIVNSQECKVNGRLILDTDELRAAFGLSDETGIYGDELLVQYGGDSAEPGKWIRYREYLNIPCPGTAIDGDPNVSIQLSDDNEVQNAVQKLITLHNLPPLSYG